MADGSPDRDETGEALAKRYVELHSADRHAARDLFESAVMTRHAVSFVAHLASNEAIEVRRLAATEIGTLVAAGELAIAASMLTAEDTAVLALDLLAFAVGTRRVDPFEALVIARQSGRDAIIDRRI